MKSKPYLYAIALALCLIYLAACASSSKTVIEQGTKEVPTAGGIQFDFADGESLPVLQNVQKQSFAIKEFRIGSGRNRMLIVGVHVEEKGRENVGDMGIAGVTCGGRELTLMSGSEVQLSEMWRGDEYYLKVALYYLINPPSGTHDIEVNAQQSAPVTLVTNKQMKQTIIITKITTKNDGAWVVDIVGCGHKSKLHPKTQDHIRRFNTQETSGGKSSMVGGTLPVLNAGEVTLHWAQYTRSINRLGHMAVEIAPYK